MWELASKAISIISSVVFHCNSPSAGPQIVNSPQYENEEIIVNPYTIRMRLTIRNLKVTLMLYFVHKNM